MGELFFKNPEPHVSDKRFENLKIILLAQKLTTEIMIRRKVKRIFRSSCTEIFRKNRFDYARRLV